MVPRSSLTPNIRCMGIVPVRFARNSNSPRVRVSGKSARGAITFAPFGLDKMRRIGVPSLSPTVSASVRRLRKRLTDLAHHGGTDTLRPGTQSSCFSNSAALGLDKPQTFWEAKVCATPLLPSGHPNDLGEALFPISREVSEFVRRPVENSADSILQAGLS